LNGHRADTFEAGGAAVTAARKIVDGDGDLTIGGEY